MTTARQARTALRARLEAGSVVDGSSNPLPFRWQNEAMDSQGNTELPDTPAPFAYVEFITDRASLVSFGGGRGNNLHRNPAMLVAYVFVPKDEGLDEAESIAEQIAALFRSHRDSDVSCFEASVMPGGDGAMLKPPGLTSDVGNYFYAVTEVSLHFDQIG
jgi:hypothetical protein